VDTRTRTLCQPLRPLDAATEDTFDYRKAHWERSKTADAEKGVWAEEGDSSILPEASIVVDRFLSRCASVDSPPAGSLPQKLFARLRVRTAALHACPWHACQLPFHGFWRSAESSKQLKRLLAPLHHLCSFDCVLTLVSDALAAL
jgi:hypothetical protein